MTPSESEAPRGWEETPLRGPAGGPLTVSEVTRAIREILESSFPRLSVRGEVTNLSRPQSGHLYFSLVDDTQASTGSRLSRAQLACVLWRSHAAKLRTRLENGEKVVVTGRLGVYEPRGTYQLVVEAVELAGLGDLQRLFEELKDRLYREGLFRPEAKRPLPFLPRRIGIVTSPRGAALQDVLRVLYRRCPETSVRLVPVRVQGEGAAREISLAVRALQAGEGQVDVILLTRGGGSLEDLWPFNDEELARTLARSKIPTVSAVGHEVDFSISDFVADVRAQTPTKAGEVLVPDSQDLRRRLVLLQRRLFLGLRAVVTRRDAELRRTLRSRFLRRPESLAQDLSARCDDLTRDLKIRLYNRKRQWEDTLHSVLSRLEALNPRRVLGRGYSLTTDLHGRVITDAALVARGDLLRVEFARGNAETRVVRRETQEGVSEPPAPETNGRGAGSGSWQSQER